MTVGEHVASCLDVDLTTCAGVATAAIRNLGRVGPIGTINARARLACPPVASGVDGSECWQVETSFATGTSCKVVARRADGSYVPVAGDPPAGRALTVPWEPSGCPSEGAYLPLDPPAPPAEAEGPCGDTRGIIDRFAPTTIERRVRGSAGAVLVGRITEVGMAQWNTPDGTPPDRPYVSNTGVFRLVRVWVEAVVKGAAPAQVAVWIPSGEIGCRRFMPALVPFDLEIGARYVFFLGGAFLGGADQEKPNGVLGVAEMWAVDDDGVATPDEGRVPLRTFIERAFLASR